jgi:UDP-glucose 4-epimerase
VRFLVTGGAGFIGSHLSDLLIENGHSVHVLDDLSTGQIENIAPLAHHPRFDCTIASVAERGVVAGLIGGVDAVIHLAAAVGVRLVVESPVRAIETNVRCTEVVLAQADIQKKPVMIASTSEVYGKSEALPFREDGDLQMGATAKARWAYACSKAIDEFLAMAYWRERQLPISVVRLFNTVGPRQTGNYGMVVPRLVGVWRWKADALLLSRRRRRARPARAAR